MVDFLVQLWHTCPRTGKHGETEENPLESPIRADLIETPSKSVYAALSFAARTCYQPEKPADGKEIDVGARIVSTGHHTVLQHANFTFYIEGIAVSAVTLGLHLCSPFYNSSQRSGRYCMDMFSNPDPGAIDRYVRRYWPGLPEESYRAVLDYVSGSLSRYLRHLPDATKAAEEAIRKERPRAQDKFVLSNAPKFAQEQLRMLVPTVFPTALTYTCNLSALAALYRAAWTPDLQDLTRQMADLVRPFLPDGKGGNLGDILFPETRRTKWSVPFGGDNRFSDTKDAVLPLHEPRVLLEGILGQDEYAEPDREDTFPTDLLHFHPDYLNNNTGEIRTRITISLATMGQDQRHRTVRRGLPEFVPYAYVPPLVRATGAEQDVVDTVSSWIALRKILPATLVERIAPYGACVRYRKVASFNSAIHELEKRTCWNAQEEIHSAALLLKDTVERECGPGSPILGMFHPGCIRTGRCVEGARYCGRDLSATPFSRRTA